jgi:uncharacterized protein
MPTTRVGVVADTHCPEFIGRLPDTVLRALQGVRLIIHAGDVNGQSTLDALAEVAPVEAVRGDHDRALGSLPRIRELTVEGRRIVVLHGDRSRWAEEPQTLLWTLSLGRYRPHKRLPLLLRRRFPDADVIVYGHTHRPEMWHLAGGPLVFNPGAVFQWTPATARQRLAARPGWFEWSWLQFARRMRVGARPSVGILELRDGDIRPKIVPV